MRRRQKGWAKTCERACCRTITYFPLAFVYGLTTWAVWVEAGIGFGHATKGWIRMNYAPIVLYLVELMMH